MYLFCTRHGKPYTPSGFASIWQRKMASAMKEGILKVRFSDQDLRSKTASDLDDPQKAMKLLGHSDIRITQKHYLLKLSTSSQGSRATLEQYIGRFGIYWKMKKLNSATAQRLWWPETESNCRHEDFQFVQIAT